MYNFLLIRKKVKNISIKIKSGKLIVVAPKNISLEYLKNFVISKSNWIEKAKYFYQAREEFFNKNVVLNFLDDEFIFFLGENYKIKIIESNENLIKIRDENLTFFLKKENNNFAYKKKFFDKWIKKEEKMIFEKLLIDIYQKYFANVLKKIPQLKIRKMKSTWGICNYKKNFITLNSELIKCEKKIISYILIHEFTHFFYQDHSKNFYEFIKKIVPEYKTFESRLKNFN